MKVIQLHNNNIELIKKASKNDRQAQHMLYETHAPKMMSICRYFFKAFTNLTNFKYEGSFEGWLRKIMVREAISYIRQVKKIEFSVEDFEVYQEQTNNIETAIELNEIQQYIDELPEGYKMVFVMYAVEGYKHHEIASLLNINEGTSKSQLYKARQLLQEKINRSNVLNHVTDEMGR